MPKKFTMFNLVFRRVKSLISVKIFLFLLIFKDKINAHDSVYPNTYSVATYCQIQIEHHSEYSSSLFFYSSSLSIIRLFIYEIIPDKIIVKYNFYYEILLTSKQDFLIKEQYVRNENYISVAKQNINIKKKDKKSLIKC